MDIQPIVNGIIVGLVLLSLGKIWTMAKCPARKLTLFIPAQMRAIGNSGVIESNLLAGIFVTVVVIGGLELALSITGLEPIRELVAFYS